MPSQDVSGQKLPPMPMKLDEAAIRQVIADSASGSERLRQAVDPYLPQVVATIMRGALIVGPAGHPDRMTLFRMLGLPWTPHSKEAGRSGEMDATSAQRMSAAIGRIERRLSGHAPVTLDADDGEEGPKMLARGGVVQVIEDQMPHPLPVEPAQAGRQEGRWRGQGGEEGAGG